MTLTEYNKRQRVDDNDTTSQESREFDVLYYKRKNKVHKSKGVSKMDGILTILPAPSSIVTLMDGGTTIFRGIQSEISKRDLQVDDIVMMGAYELQLLADRTTSNTRTQAPATTVIKAPRALAIKRTGPLHAASRSTLPGRGIGATTTVRQPPRKVLPVATSSASKPDEYISSASDDENSEPETSNENLSGKRSLVLSATASLTRRLPAFQRVTRKITPVLKKATLSTTTKPSAPVVAVPRPNDKSTTSDLNAITIDVPNSIRTVLRPHQVEGVTFLWNCLTGHGKAVSPYVDTNQAYKGAILADEMGLGKTLMTIAVICALHRQKRDSKFVVVCPSSLVTNWANEFEKWIGKASQPKRVVVKGGGEEGTRKLKAFCSLKGNNQSEVLIISYDLFRMNTELFQQQIKKVALLVVDEGHRLKNTSGSLTLTALESLPSEARLCITATPIQNILSDFYTIANFACPGLLGDLATFRREFERPISASNNKAASTEQRNRGLAQSVALEEITRTFMLRRLQKDILKTLLPPRDEVLLFCSPTPAQCAMYKEMTKFQDAGVVAGVTSDALTALTSLRKICSHPHLTDPKPRQFDESDVALSGKLTVLDSLLANIRTKAPKDKIVIVSNFTSALSIIENSVLKPRDLNYQRLDGSTELSNRQVIVDTFNKTSAERNFALLLSSKAGGCGLNLIGANRLVMFDPDWNPASDIQAMARVYRQGQTKRCIIYRMFTSGTVEEVIYQRQIQKGNLATLTVDGEVPVSMGKASGFTKEELRDCFTLKENCRCDTKRKLGSQWPSYDGTESLLSQGCVDEPLLDLASAEAGPLAFVHVVDDTVETEQLRKIAPTQQRDSGASVASESSEEEEFNDDASEEPVGKQVEESSEEEFEFGDD